MRQLLDRLRPGQERPAGCSVAQDLEALPVHVVAASEDLEQLVLSERTPQTLDDQAAIRRELRSSHADALRRLGIVLHDIRQHPRVQSALRRDLLGPSLRRHLLDGLRMHHGLPVDELHRPLLILLHLAIEHSHVGVRIRDTVVDDLLELGAKGLELPVLLLIPSGLELRNPFA